MTFHIDVSSGTVLYLLVIYVLARLVGAFMEAAGRDLGAWVTVAMTAWAKRMKANR